MCIFISTNLINKFLSSMWLTGRTQQQQKSLFSFTYEFHSLNHTNDSKNTWIQRNILQSGWSLYSCAIYTALSPKIMRPTNFRIFSEHWKLYTIQSISNSPMQTQIWSVCSKEKRENVRERKIARNCVINPLFRWPICSDYFSICVCLNLANQNTAEKTNIQRNRTDA